VEKGNIIIIVFNIYLF